jgi:hypothetical protein
LERRVLQIPADPHRGHCVKTGVRAHRCLNGTLAVFPGPRLLARYGLRPPCPAGERTKADNSFATKPENIALRDAKLPCEEQQAVDPEMQSLTSRGWTDLFGRI